MASVITNTHTLIYIFDKIFPWDLEKFSPTPYFPFCILRLSSDVYYFNNFDGLYISSNINDMEFVLETCNSPLRQKSHVENPVSDYSNDVLAPHILAPP